MRKFCVTAFLALMILTGFSHASGGSTQTVHVSSGDWGEEWAGGLGSILDVSYSHDGSLIAFSGSTVIQVMDASTYDVVKQFCGNRQKIPSMVFSPDDKYIASCSADGTANIWDVRNGSCIKTVDVCSYGVLSVDWSKNNEIAFGDAKGYVTIYSISGEEKLRFKAHNDDVNSVSFSHNGNFICSGGSTNDPTVKLWNATSGELLSTFKEHADSITSVSFSPDDKNIASSSADTTIRIWDVETNESETLEGHSSIVNSVIWFKDGESILSCSDDETIKIWDIETEEYEDIEEDAPVNCVTLSPNEDEIFSGLDYVIRIWDLDDKICVNEFKYHSDRIVSVDFSSDGTKIVSSSRENFAILWSLKGNKWVELDRAELDVSVNSVDFSPSGNKVALGCSDSSVKVWDINTDNIENLVENAHNGAVNVVKFSPDATMLLTIGARIHINDPPDYTVKVWETNGELKSVLRGHTTNINSVDWSADSRYIIAGAYETYKVDIRIWDVESSECVEVMSATSSGTSCVAWSHSDYFLTGTYPGMKIWKWDETNNDAVFVKNLGFVNSRVRSAVWSPDDKMIATGSDGIVIIWDVNSGGEICKLIGPEYDGATYNNVRCVAWSGNNKIVSGEDHAIVRIFKPILSVSAEVETKLLSNDETSINIHVSYIGEPISNADITVSSDIGEVTPSTGTTDANGNINIMFYAPSVIRNTTCNIRITASKLGSGYGDGKINIPIIVYPKILLINAEGEADVYSNKTATINIYVSDYLGPIENADITVSSEYVAEKTGKTDLNGNLNITFNAPKTKTEKTCTIMITASKEGYPDAHFTFNINVKPETEKPSAPPLIYLLLFILTVIAATAALLLYVLIRAKRK
ncbi:MAG: hypothetical protein QMC80_05085 [Thermoplasmatales archaeon]|nr:hypothetical protein [Thermoplasmatales archaeon]